MRRRILLDSGILLRYAVTADGDHVRIRNRIERLIEEDWEILFASQAVRESWNILTRPIDVGGYGYTIKEAESTLVLVEKAFTFVEDTPDIFCQWRTLVAKYGIVGKSVHDANVVATALAHGATHILTLNERDFRRYAEVETLVP